MKWINVLGIILQFVAFWFAAPELLGVNALKRFEDGLKKLISNLPSLLIGIGGAILGITMGIYGAIKGMEATEDSSSVVQTMIILLSVSLAYMVFILFLSKRLSKWIAKTIASPLVEKLIENNESRKNALIIGAVLFTLGFLCQLIVAAF